MPPGTTYNQSANQVLYLVITKVEILISAGKLGEVESNLLLANRASGEVRLQEWMWYRLCSDASTSVGVVIAHILDTRAVNS